MNPTDRFRSLLSEGHSRDEALSELKRAGSSPMACIGALVEVERLGLAEAKRALSESPAWSEYVRSNDEWLLSEFKTMRSE